MSMGNMERAEGQQARQQVIERRYILRGPNNVRNCIRHITEEVPLPEGKQRPYVVIIKPHVESLTEEQRNGFHWLCKMLGDELGYTLHEIKEMVKQECLGTKLVRIGEHEREVTPSSEKLNKLQYSELIEGVYRLGAEAGVYLPTLDRWRVAG